MRVLVTDADSRFARALLPALLAHREVESVTGVGRTLATFGHEHFRALQADYTDPAALPSLAGHDVLVHLARTPSRRAADSDALDAVVRPVHRFFHAARDAGVQRFIHLSTAAVYGEAVHAAEHSPLKPLPGFRYAEEQAHLERLLAIDFPECARLRPHLILGPHAHPTLKRVLRQPFYPRADEREARFQCIHEDDLATAVVLCLEAGARGAYNIATEDSFSLREAIRARRWFALGLAPAGTRRAIDIANRFLKADIDPVWLDRAGHTLLINCRRAIIDLGWRQRYSARDTLAAT